MVLRMGSGPSDVVLVAGVRVMALGSAARCGQGSESGQDGQDNAGPAAAGGEVQDGAAGTDGEPAGGREQPQPESFRFPAPSLVGGRVGRVGAAVQLQPSGEVGGEGDDLAPDLVGGEPVQGQVGQAAVFGVADPVRPREREVPPAAGPAAVA